MNSVNIGILGFGNVGTGTYEILTKNKELIEKNTGLSPKVSKILKRNLSNFGPLKDNSILTKDADDILEDPNIDIVVEVMGGIEPATSYMLKAMKNGKSVVSANKAAIAKNFELLNKTAKENNVSFLFEASVCGGIPVLSSILDPLQCNNFSEVMGILNGTTNYILTKMADLGQSYEEALKSAQELGFAEADPTADVEGIDAANKLSILMDLLFDAHIDPDEIDREGITNITPADIEKAKKSGKVIKLIGKAKFESGSLSCQVAPTFLDDTHPLAGVKNEYNAVYVTGDMVGDLMFYGRGAGPLPTGSAVSGDIAKIMKNFKR